uniref:Protein phosphatase 1 regulatory inhibitor subunit 1C n=1 Tax=Cyanistes caeruleus TaxID=156563 RepID=A0A8C0VUC5_CYACU
MWHKGVARLPQIPVLSRELQLLLRSSAWLWGRRRGRGTDPVSSSSLASRLSHLSTTMEPNSPKKIQFAVPLFQSQIDPEAAEQIRKRRPTPASLVIMNEHMPPGSRNCQSSRMKHSEVLLLFMFFLGSQHADVPQRTDVVVLFILWNQTALTESAVLSR